MEIGVVDADLLDKGTRITSSTRSRRSLSTSRGGATNNVFQGDDVRRVRRNLRLAEDARTTSIPRLTTASSDVRSRFF